jgi:hypothetical protein
MDVRQIRVLKMYETGTLNTPETMAHSGICCARETKGCVSVCFTYLPVLTSRLVLDLGEHVEVEVTIDAALGAVAGRDTRKLVAKDRHARNVYQTAVGAS